MILCIFFMLQAEFSSVSQKAHDKILYLLILKIYIHPFIYLLT